MFDVGNEFSANQVMCYGGFGFAERQMLFSDVKIHGSSGVMEHAMVVVSPLRRSVVMGLNPDRTKLGLCSTSVKSCQSCTEKGL